MSCTSCVGHEGVELVELKVGHKLHAVPIVSARGVVEGLCHHWLSDGGYNLCPGGCVGHNVE